MPAVPRRVGLLAALAVVLAAAGPAPAGLKPGDPPVQAAVDKAVGYLKQRAQNPGSQGDHGIGPSALVGIALIEALVPPSDPAIQATAKAVREIALSETRTYQASLCLMFLDKLGEPEDVPLIQMLAVRLLVGQSVKGGWDYNCASSGALPAELEAGLKGRKLAPGVRSNEGKPQLHPAVQAYWQQLANANKQPDGDDNSNTQFAVLAVWAARKHGVPVDGALNAIADRFVKRQNQDGGWAYTSADAVTAPSRAAMTCAGLIGLSTYIARAEEGWARRAADQKDKQKDKAKKDPKPGDEFYAPPGKAEKLDVRPKTTAPDRASGGALQALGGFLGQAVGGTGTNTSGARMDDLYFLWSLERVGVVYGIDRFGTLDWYDIGATYLLKVQKKDGSFSVGAYGDEVQTSFAVLFLVKANPAKDLVSSMKGKGEVELRGKGSGGGAAAEPSAVRPPKPAGGAAPANPDALPALPEQGEAGRLAADLVEKSGGEFEDTLKTLVESKGTDYTQALILAIDRLDADRRRQARQGLADRFFRMSDKTLRAMMKAEQPEMRRGAVMAAAMKDDKAHVPDLIDRIAADDEDLVIRAARAGLVSLTGSKEDFGPPDGSEKPARQAAADKWRAFWAKQKK